MFNQDNPNEILTVEQLCERLSISQSTAYKLLQSGQIIGFRLGSWKVPLSSVYEYVNKKCDKK